MFEESILDEKNETSTIVPAITISPSPLTLPKRPHIHPAVSRLRSIVPQRSLSDSLDSSILSPLDSNFSHSTLSRRSSILSEFANTNGEKPLPREAFKWTPLKVINSQIFSTNRARADADIEHGEPTVIATNGLVCVGTSKGRVLVFDFKQVLRCICGATPQGNPSKSRKRVEY